MAGCMVFVFAALGEFVVVKVLDVHYQEHKAAQRQANGAQVQQSERTSTRSIARIFPLVCLNKELIHPKNYNI